MAEKKENKWFPIHRKIFTMLIVQFVIIVGLIIYINERAQIRKLEKLPNQISGFEQKFNDKFDQLFARMDATDEKNKDRDLKLSHIPDISPINPVNINGISSKYGEQRKDSTGKIEIHSGMDIRAEKGTEVLAMADGVVRIAGWDDGWGQRILINHLNGYETSYSHLIKVLVKPNEAVYKGEVIGEVGSTGNSTGNHLDLRIYYSGKAINPNLFF